MESDACKDDHLDGNTFFDYFGLFSIARQNIASDAECAVNFDLEKVLSFRESSGKTNFSYLSPESPVKAISVKDNTQKSITTHPLVDNRYEVGEWLRYPKNKASSSSSLGMFCFPNDIQLIYSYHKRPLSTFHSFVTTAENGCHSYAVTVIFWELVMSHYHQSLRNLCRDWLEKTFSSTEIEYYRHLHGLLLECKGRMEDLCANVNENIDDSSIKEIKEKITLYEAMLTKCHPAAFCDPGNPDEIWQPYAVVLTCKYPFFNVMKDWLAKIVYQIQNEKSLSIPLENYIFNIMHEIPLPPPGKMQVEFRVENMPLFLSLPPVNRIPVVKDISLCPLLTCLSIPNILVIYEAMLNEKKIVLVSSCLALVSVICESFRILSYPFPWQYVYIPVVPRKLLDCLDAPIPLLVGIHASNLNMDRIQEDTLVVHLDHSLILKNPVGLVNLPARVRKKLSHRLELHYAKLMHGFSASEARKAIKKTVKASNSSTSSNQSIFQHTLYSGLKVPGYIQNTFYLDQATEKEKEIFLPSQYDYNRLSVGNFYQRDGGSFVSPNSSNPSLSVVTFGGGNSESNTITESSVDGTVDSDDALTMSSSTTSNRSKPSFSMSSNQVTGISSRSSFRSSFHADRRSSLLGPAMSHDSRNYRFRSSFSGSTDGTGVLVRRQIKSEVNVYPKNNQIPLSDTHEKVSDSNENVSKVNLTPLEEKQSKEGKKKIKFLEKAKQFFGKRRSVVVDDGQAGGPNGTSKSEESNSVVIEADRNIELLETHDLSLLEPSQVAQGTLSGARCFVCRKVFEADQNKPVVNCIRCPCLVHEHCLDRLYTPCHSFLCDYKIQEAFFRCFLTMFKNFGNFLIVRNDDEVVLDRWTVTTESLFRCRDFISAIDRESRPFMEMFLKTQNFANFVFHHATKSENDYDILFLTEAIKAKKNKSSVQIVKKSTPFLLDQSFAIQESVHAPEPLCNHESGVMGYGPGFPKQLDYDLLNSLSLRARKMAPLFDEKQKILLKMHTSNLRREARLNNYDSKSSNALNSISRFYRKFFSGDVHLHQSNPSTSSYSTSSATTTPSSAGPGSNNNAFTSPDRQYPIINHNKISSNCNTAASMKYYDTRMKYVYSSFREILIDDIDIQYLNEQDLENQRRKLDHIHGILIQLMDQDILVVRSLQEEVQIILKEVLSYSAKIHERIRELEAIAEEACEEWWKFHWRFVNK